MEKHAEYNADRLTTARREKDRVQRCRWIGHGSMLLTAVILMTATLDYWLLLPAWTRSIALIAFATGGIWGLARVIETYLLPSNLKDVALDFEKSRPELGCVVSTAVELIEREPKESGQPYELAIVRALQEQAAKKLMVIESPYRKKLLPAVTSGFTALLLLALFFLFLPSPTTALTRTIFPWINSAYTTITVQPGNAEIPDGSDVIIEASVRGRIPSKPLLQWIRQDESKWSQVLLTNLQARNFSGVLPNIKDSVRYRVLAKEGASPVFELKTFIHPQIKELKILVDFPAYTQQKQWHEPDPNLSIVRGSALNFQILTTGQVGTARLRFSNMEPVSLQNSSNEVWTAKFLPQHDTHYWIELTDKAGRTGGNEKPYQIAVLPDEAPRVSIAEPGLDIAAKATEKIPVKINVTDDFGVADVTLHFRRMGGSEHKVACRKVEDTGKEVVAVAEIDLAPLALKDYEVIAYHAEARDNNTLDGPGSGKSTTYFIEITDKEREPTLSQCRGDSVNLLDLEKHLIAATTLADTTRNPAELRNLAALQRQTQDYAKLYESSPILKSAPPQARLEFKEAMGAMAEASGHLDAGNRASALSAEERALQHLYETVRLLPELEAGMCRGQKDKISVVLKEIEKLKQKQNKGFQQDLSIILQEGKRLSQEQLKLNQIYRQGNSRVPSSPLPTDAKDGTAGSSAGIQAELKDVEAEQAQLSEKAAELAAKLSELAQREPRISHGTASEMKQVSEDFRKAGRAWASRDQSSVNSWGPKGLGALVKIINTLEHVFVGATQSSGLAAEDYPKAYEALINEYFKRLSYQE